MRKINIVDTIIILGVIAALIVGILTTKHFRQTADKQIEATSQINFNVYLRGVTLTGEEIPIKRDETTFISIRNVPYSDLKVIDVESTQKMTTISSNNSVTNGPSPTRVE